MGKQELSKMDKHNLIIFLEASIMLRKKGQNENASAWIQGYETGSISTMEVILELLNNSKEEQ